jgi:hypothetical protein
MQNDTTENTTELETQTNEESQMEEGSEDGQALEAGAEEGEQLEASEEVGGDKTPAWVDFTAALSAHAQALGLAIIEQKGYTQFKNLETGHKLYVAKGDRAVKRVDTTLPILGQDGTYDVAKPNGKINCHVVVDLETVTKVLTQLADSSIGKIRTAKRSKAAVADEAPAEEAPAAE